jgi:hypothetical protein
VRLATFISVVVALVFASPVAAQERPAPLLPLYAGLGAANIMDLHSTHLGLSRGLVREANPAMRSAPMRYTLKVASTGLLIAGAETLWKSGRRKTAVFLVGAVAGSTAVVAAHNYRIARR